MFCSHCGAEVNDNAVVCVKCGCALKNYNQLTLHDSTTYILLGVLLGSLGAHNFYIGNKTVGFIQLALSLLSCGVFAIFVNIWAIVEVCTNAKNLK